MQLGRRAGELCGQLAQRKEHRGAAQGLLWDSQFHWELSLPIKVRLNPWVREALKSGNLGGFACTALLSKGLWQLQEPAELCCGFPSVTKAQTKPFSFIEPVLYNSALGTLS